MLSWALCLRRTAAASVICLAAPAFAADAAAPGRDPEGVVTLSSSATTEVAKDWMSVTFSVAREGADAAAVQGQLKEALEAALKQAQAARRPDGQLEVQTGAFSLQPRYSNKGQMNGWSGSAELVVQGRDMPAIAALAGRIASMSIAHLDYSLSRDTREKVEADVAAQAIAGFRAKATTYAKAFGYSGFNLREVEVQADEPVHPPRPMFARMAVAQAEAAPLPVEAGEGSVTVTVSGSIQMTR